MPPRIVTGILLMVAAGCMEPTDAPDAGVLCFGNTSECNGVCVDLTRDEANCGRCDTRCPSGLVCERSSCLLECSAAQTRCSTGCAVLEDDPQNCGACGTTCASGQACEAGVCIRRCLPTQFLCGARCVDLDTDPAHCGACDAACSPGQQCRGGTCRPCTAPLTECGPDCADLNTDPAHCGACNNSCGTDEQCSGGACLGCTSPRVRCGVGCYDLGRDRANCGGCGVVCAENELCRSGVCTGCPLETDPCGPDCIDPLTDPANCGGCGNGCSAGEQCIAGNCLCIGSCTADGGTSDAGGDGGFDGGISDGGPSGPCSTPLPDRGTDGGTPPGANCGILSAPPIDPWACSVDCWCKEDPFSIREPLRAVTAGAIDGHYWAFGERGTAAVHDGHVWLRRDIGTTVDIHAAWTSPAGEIWVAGNCGLVRRMDAGGWTDRSIPGGLHLRGIWGASSSIWVVGEQGSIYRLQAGSWSRLTIPTGEDLHAIHGTNSQDIWVVGNGGVILHRTVSGWDPVASPVSGALWGLHVRDAFTAWAVGDAGFVLTWDGTSWSQSRPVTETLFAVAARPGDVVGIAVGSNGTIVRTDGWQPWWGPNTSHLYAVEAAYNLRGAVAELAVGADGTRIARGIADNRSYPRVASIWPEPDGTMLLASGDSTLLRFDGQQWNSHPGRASSAPRRVWGAGANEAWVVGHDIVMRWDGLLATDFSALNPNTFDDYEWIWGFGPSDVWLWNAAGDRAHWDGATWTFDVIPFSQSGWGAAPDDIWFSGWNGFEQWDGSSFAFYPIVVNPPVVVPGGIWGSASDDVWSVDGEHIFHWDGSSWTEVLQTSGSWNTVWTSGPNDVWVGGGSGGLLHWDGTTWTSVDSGTTAGIRELRGTGPYDVWAIDSSYALIHYRP